MLPLLWLCSGGDNPEGVSDNNFALLKDLVWVSGSDSACRGTAQRISHDDQPMVIRWFGGC